MMTSTNVLYFFVFLLFLGARASSYIRYDKNQLDATFDTKTTWNPNGKTVAGANGPGSALNQLNSSYGIFIDSTGTLFITDNSNHRVVKWEKDALTGSLYAGGSCNPTGQVQFCYPTTITFNREGTMFVTVNNDSTGSVIMLKKGAAQAEQFIIGNSSFLGISWDEKEEYLYLGHHQEHRVVKYTKDGKLVGVVAGGNGRGPALSQLNYARGVAVDENGSVYVADSNNHRVVKWVVGATVGAVIAGGNGNGSRTDQLHTPAGLVRDKNGIIYVADEMNHRIVSISPGAKDGVIIAGGHGQGSSSNQLSNPFYVAFNGNGDLYVSDWNNYRVQMFAKQTNPPSDSHSDYYFTTARKWTQISCFLSLMFFSVRIL